MNDPKKKTALTIAGSDPSGGAGFHADMKTFHAMGVYGLSIAAVLTAQSTEGVRGIHELPSGFVRDQMDILLGDITPDAIKTGMLYSADIIAVVAEKIAELSPENFVIDPVAVSSTGVLLIEEKGMDIVKNRLFPLSKIITPNIYEASVFTGIEIEDEKDMKEAAARLKEFGPQCVIITGGHLGDKAMDILFDGKEFLSLENDRLEGEFHGTGCVFSASITACLALGHDSREAFIKAKDFTYTAMKRAIAVGGGMRVLNV